MNYCDSILVCECIVCECIVCECKEELVNLQC